MAYIDFDNSVLTSLTKIQEAIEKSLLLNGRELMDMKICVEKSQLSIATESNEL